MNQVTRGFLSHTQLESDSNKLQVDNDFCDDDESVIETYLHRSEQEPGEASTSNRVEVLWKMVEEIVANDSKSKVLPAVQSWVAEGNELTKFTLNTIIMRFRNHSRFRQAFELSEWLVTEKQFDVDQWDAIFYIDILSRVAHITKVDKAFEDLSPEHKTETAYNTLIGIYAHKNLISKAHTTLDMVKKLNLITSPYAFNQLMLMHKRMGQDEKVLAVFNDLNALHVAPDIHTYNILLRLQKKTDNPAGRNEEVEAAMRQTELDMETGLLMKKKSSYELLLRMYGTLGKLDGVQRMQKILEKFPGRANSSYISSIETLGLLGELEEAEKIFDEMETVNGLTRTRQFTSMISVYSNVGEMDKAEKLFRRMLDDGHEPNDVVYQYLVRGYLKNKECDKAFATFKKATEGVLQNKRTKPKFETALLVLNAHSEKGDIDSAEQVFEYCRNNYRKELSIYKSLLKAYLRAKVPAFGFHERMIADGIHLDSETWELLNELKL
ncbi:hypothetical protein O6H91_04G013600 [Diphasiastrum complanatum]|nr:hypothetical protein O6H91_04G013600 [Diphasiastrum complanatum]KAJ7557881.1 hypothetical protein O6H91_04G013600 [Diphasiastrum complanatum]KAJ7557882.1 hypothetical protein O6H91_04G013600 [Diphasiastrum complanatum]